MKPYFLIIAAVILLGAGCTNPEIQAPVALENQEVKDIPSAAQDARLDFSQYNNVYRFSAVLPENLEVRYVSEIKSITLSDGVSDQIFIRFFEANDFLTLQTVDILEREETAVRGHAAVRYEIQKKPNVANFPSQPAWRNGRHKLIDIRYRPGNPSYFYVLAYNPAYSGEKFESFIQSLQFYNDAASFVEPLGRTGERMRKKPFGIFITPEASPVSPEKFRGFHTGTDFEILLGEENARVAVQAICGGEITVKRVASGYGGLLAQKCEREGKILQMIYGHLTLSSIKHKIGDYLAPGEEIGILGEAGPDTDNERKHLHLGVYAGAKLDVSGYAPTAGALDNWIDVETLL